MATKELTWREAIERVLSEKGEPMNYLAITEEILEQNLRVSTGATPSYTVAAQLTQDLALPKGQSKFTRVSRGIYGLAAWGSAVASTTAEAGIHGTAFQPGVQAYGMYWERSSVDWTKSSIALWGQQYQKSDQVDFAGQRGLYLLYDHRSIIYVGRATQQSLGSRLRDHTCDRLRSRWDRFSWFCFWGVKESGELVSLWDESFDTETMISQVEGVFIEALEPTQNRQAGKGFVGIEYLQVEDPSFREQRTKALSSLVDRL